MTNGEMLRQFTDEQLAEFIAHERFRLMKPLVEYFGYGITEEFLYSRMLKWIKENSE